MSIEGTVSLSFVANDRRTIGLNSNTNIPVNATPGVTYSNGSGAAQVATLFQAVRTFSGSTDVLDLNTGLTDSYGTAVALVRIKAIAIINNGTAAITIGAGTDPITTLLNSTGTLTLPVGAWFAAATPDATGWVVTASTACNLQVSGTSGQTYEVVVLGSAS